MLKLNFNLPLQNKNPVFNDDNKFETLSATWKSSFIASNIIPNEYITPSRIKLTNLIELKKREVETKKHKKI